MRTTRPPPPPAAPPPHTEFGQFTLLDRIAVGGMAEVFRAVETRSANVIVVKRMLPSLAIDPVARAMFEEEARISMRVAHGNVVRCLGAGTHEGQPFLALEFVPGVDLWRMTRWLTRRSRTVGVAVSIHIARSILAGLQAVHDAADESGRPLGIVHRDVSPSNVLLSVEGDVKLGDLGIAWAQLRERQPLAPMNERAKGKLGYLAPEQVAGAPVDQRADVFSAGVVAAELLLGRPLFQGGSELAVLLSIRDAEIKPFLDIIHTLPDGLGHVIAGALSRDPRERIATATELNDRLAEYDTALPSRLRRELGDLVKEAAAAREDAGGALPVAIATPLDPVDQPTPAREDLRLEFDPDPQLTPLQVMEPELTPLHEVIEDAAPRTADMPTLEYSVTTHSGELIKGLSYAKLIEAVATGRVAPHDTVHAPDGQTHTVKEMTELSRHLPSMSGGTTTRQEAPRADGEFSIAQGGVVRALAVAALTEETGLLLCEHGGVRKEVYFLKGRPEFVSSNLAGELLGEYLVAKNVLSRGELDMALAIMPRYEGRLGDTLSALGLVEPVHLFRHIASQVRDKLLDLFLWSSGKASMYRNVEPPPSGFPLAIDPWQIIDEGIKRRIAEGLEDDVFSTHAGVKLERVVPPPSDVKIAKLPAEALQALTQLSRPATIGELGRAMPPPTQGGFDFGAKPVVALLLHLGAIRWSR